MNMMWIKLKAPHGTLLVNMAHVTSVYSNDEGHNFIQLLGDPEPFRIEEDADRVWVTISETMAALKGSTMLATHPTQGNA